MLRPITADNAGDAVTVLARGFPSHPAQFWQSGLERLARYQTGAPLGYLLSAGGKDAGVILTIASAQPDGDGRLRKIVNLSSWYIDEAARWLAPRMLQQVVADDSVLYTDLTPTPSVSRLVGRFGFSPWTDGIALFVLPWSALGRARADVQRFDRLPHDAFPAAIREMLAQHQEFGCIAAGLWDGETLHPLIFSRLRRAVPAVRLIYAASNALVAAHIGSISRFLMRERCALLAVNADRREPMPGGFFLPRAAPTFYKGAMDRRTVNHAYSEFVILQI